MLLTPRLALTLTLLAVVAGITSARAGDTYAAIEAKGDYINYAPAVAPPDTRIVIARDSARYEPRWQPMLDDADLRILIFLQAQRTRTYNIARSP